MKKICILEDNEADAIRRYAPLTQTAHDVYIVLDEEVLYALGRDRVDRVRRDISTRLSEAGFKPDNIQYGFENTPTDASVYFSDGLKGQCLELAERLGKDRVYINTTNSDLEALAKQEGFRILDKPALDIVKDLK